MRSSTLFTLLIVLTVAALASRAAAAQGSRLSTADSTVIARIQQRVESGDGAGARALADSLLGAVDSESAAYPEALYWRSVVATSASEAERGYLRVIVEYPLSARAADAELRLAQLELGRGDRDRARAHLEQLTREHPGGPTATRASYLLGRTLIDQGDFPSGCASIAAARKSVDRSDIELANQIDYYASRCASVAVTPVTPVTPPPDTTHANAPKTGRGGGGAARTPATTTTKGTKGAANVKGANGAQTVARGAARDTTSRIAAPGGRAGTPRDTLPRDTVASDVSRHTHPGSQVTPPTGAARTPRDTLPRDTIAPAAPSPPPPARPVQYSVQAGAFKTRREAAALVTRLKARGFSTPRIEGTRAPFRVRLGHYASHDEAAAVMQGLKRRGFAATIVEAEGGGGGSGR